MLIIKSMHLINLHFWTYLVSIETIYQTLKIVLNYISKHIKVCQKYSITRRIFFLFSVSGNVIKLGLSRLI